MCSSLKELFENVDATTIKAFIKEINFLPTCIVFVVLTCHSETTHSLTPPPHLHATNMLTNRQLLHLLRQQQLDWNLKTSLSKLDHSEFPIHGSNKLKTPPFNSLHAVVLQFFLLVYCSLCQEISRQHCYVNCNAIMWMQCSAVTEH